MEWLNEEDSKWKASFEKELKLPIELESPTEVSLDHGGEFVSGIVVNDLYLLEECDGVIAVFTDKNQVGTMCEVFHALRLGKPVIALFTVELLNPVVYDEGEQDLVYFSRSDRKYVEVDRVFLRGESNDYWFFINYLLGDESSYGKHEGFRNIKVISIKSLDVSTVSEVVMKWLVEAGLI